MERQKLTRVIEYLNSLEYSVKSVKESCVTISLYLSDGTEYMTTRTINKVRDIWDNPVNIGVRDGWLVVLLLR